MPEFLGKPLADLGEAAIFLIAHIVLQKEYILLSVCLCTFLFVLLNLFSEVGCSLLLFVLGKAELIVEIHEISLDLTQKVVVTYPKLGCNSNIMSLGMF